LIRLCTLLFDRFLTLTIDGTACKFIVEALNVNKVWQSSLTQLSSACSNVPVVIIFVMRAGHSGQPDGLFPSADAHAAEDGQAVERLLDAKWWCPYSCELVHDSAEARCAIWWRGLAPGMKQKPNDVRVAFMLTWQLIVFAQVKKFLPEKFIPSYAEFLKHQRQQMQQEQQLAAAQLEGGEATAVIHVSSCSWWLMAPSLAGVPAGNLWPRVACVRVSAGSNTRRCNCCQSCSGNRLWLTCITPCDHRFAGSAVRCLISHCGFAWHFRRQSSKIALHLGKTAAGNPLLLW
jgi:hypothetical protein